MALRLASPALVQLPPALHRPSGSVAFGRCDVIRKTADGEGPDGVTEARGQSRADEFVREDT